MNSKRIFLLDPPFQKFMNFSKNGIPTGLTSIAGSLKARGHEVRILDADYNPNGISYPLLAKMEHYQMYLDGLNDENHPIWKEVITQVEDFKPDLVGMTMLSSKVESGLRVASLLKRLGVPKVVCGGAHATLSPQTILSNPFVNGVLSGEGELRFEELFYKTFVQAERIEDLDALPLSARECLVGIEKYAPKDLGAIMSARGCPNSCSFCSSNSLWGRKVRTRSLENVFREVDSVHQNYGTTDFYIMDDTFTLQRNRVLSFGNGMTSRGFGWSCLTRADRMDKELAEHMVASNCHLVKIGVESGNERILDSMNKGIKLDDIRKTARVLNEAGLPWLGYFIIASPEETTSEMWDTWEFIKEIKPTYASISVYTNSPGTSFSRKYNYDREFKLSEANYHSLVVTPGKIPVDELKKFIGLVDEYNGRNK